MAETSDRPAFVYVTYIAAAPERVWEALTSGDFTRQFWAGRRIESNWQVGSPVRLVTEEGLLSDSGEVLEVDYPRRLSYSFMVEFAPDLKTEGHSRVLFELEPIDDVVKLTLVHDGFQPSSRVLQGVSSGWPRILSGMKSLLETGSAISCFPKPRVATAG